MWPNRYDLVEGVVQRRAHQVVHGRIQHQKATAVGPLIDLDHVAEQHPGIGGQQAAGFERCLDLQSVQYARAHGDIVSDRRGLRLAVIGHAQPAAEIEPGHRQALRPQGQRHVT